MRNEKLYQKAFKKWGINVHLIQGVEKLADLIHDLVKYHNDRTYSTNMLNESIAEVEILIEQVKLMLDSEKIVERKKKEKLKKIRESTNYE